MLISRSRDRGKTNLNFLGAPYTERKKRIPLVTTACGVRLLYLRTSSQLTKSYFSNNFETLILSLLDSAEAISQLVITCINSM